MRDLDRSTRFYRDVLRLPVLGSFQGHSGYDGVFFGLPGEVELELTRGPTEPIRTHEEDLLVVYVRGAEHFRSVVERLHAAGVERVASPNPYWNLWGATFLDPDGYRLVIASSEPAGQTSRGR